MIILPHDGNDVQVEFYADNHRAQDGRINWAVRRFAPHMSPYSGEVRTRLGTGAVLKTAGWARRAAQGQFSACTVL